MQALHGSEIIEILYGDKVLRFDPVEHRYWLDEMELHSATRYIKDAGYCHPFHGDGQAALIGRYKHEATAFDDLGNLKLETLDPKLKQAVELWRQFREEEGFEPDLNLMERPCYHPIYLFAGTPDVPGFSKKRNKHVVVEKKFGQEERWHHLQVGGAYTSMLAAHYEQYKGADSLLVYIPEGADRPKVVPVVDKKLPALFLSMVATVNGRSHYGD